MSEPAPALVALLDEAQRFAPEYHGGLSNHLPMALVALERLGAGEDRLREFAARYAARLAPAPAPETWPAGDAWASRLGKPDAFAAYRSLFAAWREHEGAGAMLEQVLPALMPGCGAAAFHGLIRTAYAVASRHAGELASGLAYWACRHLPLGALPERGGDADDPEPLLRTLRAARPGPGLIFERMREAAADRALQRAVARLRVHDGTLERLARLAAMAYAASGNFAMLHLVTSAHAMLVITPFLDDRDRGWRAWWQAWAATVVAARIVARPVPPAAAWDEIVARAIASDDDHVIKLADSCRELERSFGGEVWRTAATRALPAT